MKQIFFLMCLILLNSFPVYAQDTTLTDEELGYLEYIEMAFRNFGTVETITGTIEMQTSSDLSTDIERVNTYFEIMASGTMIIQPTLDRSMLTIHMTSKLDSAENDFTWTEDIESITIEDTDYMRVTSNLRDTPEGWFDPADYPEWRRLDFSGFANTPETFDDTLTPEDIQSIIRGESTLLNGQEMEVFILTHAMDPLTETDTANYIMVAEHLGASDEAVQAFLEEVEANQIMTVTIWIGSEDQRVYMIEYNFSLSEALEENGNTLMAVEQSSLIEMTYNISNELVEIETPTIGE